MTQQSHLFHEEFEEVFCRSILKKGRRIYAPKGKIFHFFVKKKEK